MSEGVNESVAKSTGPVSGSLLGEFEHALDPKKRLTIPSGWRKLLGEDSLVYVMPDRSGKCLNLLPQAEMDAMRARLAKKALFDPALSRAAMAIGRMSDALSFDSQGRIRISDRLLQLAGLTTTVTMVGSMTKVCLWNPERLRAEEGEVDLAQFNAALDLLDRPEGV